jgi:hypothetical protein
MNRDDALLASGKPAAVPENKSLALPGKVAQTLGQGYQVTGWQSGDEGFGMILYRDQVVAGITEFESLTEARVSEIVKQYQEAFGQPLRPSAGAPVKYVQYWFWYSGDPKSPSTQILMLCATEVKAEKYSLTIGVGTMPVMDVLGMTIETGSRDQKKADSLIEKQRGNSANSSNRGTP